MDVNSITSGNSAAAARVASSLGPARAKDAAQSSGTSSTSSSSGNSTITSNDFLTLLVSELKNQDPTQPTDPASYIQQLVGVNSLQQLISINQGISTLTSGIATSTTPTNQ
ncbi:flagellar hook capping FlgD N-terminal domain-containing protein [Edaphobacter bradus]|uniref:flagellar hook capping FlgD N-terminal domain-containing protein n=1 Tax=Edaphobacter bradus TaxID=2259016 RepID=UPI0021E0DFF0|nr:flagellar hook capping FlgD N-terminal domain-containing protein [Edaphobacter bradus]